MSRIAGVNPPSASHFNNSRAFQELLDSGPLRDVDRVRRTRRVAAVIPSALLAATSRDGIA